MYDALTSVRCYKSAYDHETALRMIVNGECGTFNPLLLECLLDASLQIRERLREANEGYMHSTARTQQLSTEMMLKQATPQVGRSIQASRPSVSRLTSLPSSPAAFSSTMMRQRAPSL